MTTTPHAIPALPARTPVICGPTAGGKSDLAVELALALRDQHNIAAEIITADAFQVYTGLDIGTAKPTIHERRGVPHHLIDIVASPNRESRFESRDSAEAAPGSADSPVPIPDSRPFTLDHWLTLANQTIADLRNNNTLPIVVGGTHLYIKALLEGLFDGPEPDPQLRAQLAAMDPVARRAELERVDPAAAARIHPNDTRRTIRALEIFRQTGVPISARQTQWDQPDHSSGVGNRESGQTLPGSADSRLPIPDSRFQLVLLDWPSKLINPRINARVKNMMERGLLDEVRALIQQSAFTPQSREALGYKQLIPLVERAITATRWPPPAHELEDAVERIKIETRRFAKNQRTWLRRLSATPGALTLAAADRPNWPAQVLQTLFSDDRPIS